MSPPAPRTWLLLAEKGGDNAQVEALAAALPWDCEVRRLVMQDRWLVRKPGVAASVDHVDLAKSDALEAPWPDLVITMGRRTGNAAFWIREQSGGRTRIALVGKPSGWMERYDLVIGSAEVQLPPFDNVQLIGLPLLRIDPDSVAAASEHWRPKWVDLPRPLVAILVGGPTGPYVFDRPVVDHLLSLARAVRAAGGTPFVTTSRRTPEDVTRALEDELPEGAKLFRWSAEASENPYRGLLGLADGFAVTGDSISMLVEVARLAKPLAIVPLSTGPFGGIDQQRRAFTRWLFAPAEPDGRGRWRAALARAVFRWHLLSHTRDFEALHDWMVRTGLASRSDGSYPAGGWTAPHGDVDDDLAAAARRVAGLFEGKAAARG